MTRNIEVGYDEDTLARRSDINYQNFPAIASIVSETLAENGEDAVRELFTYKGVNDRPARKGSNDKYTGYVYFKDDNEKTLIASVDYFAKEQKARIWAITYGVKDN